MAARVITTHLHDVAGFLRDLSAGRLDEAQFLFGFRAGNDFTGFTDLEIRGTGQARLKSTVTQDLVLFWRTVALPAPRVGRLLAALRDNELWRIDPGRTEGRLDEARVDIELRYADEWWIRSFWSESIAADYRWRGIENGLWQIVDRIARGAVLQLMP
jgi:hypothetical protein